MIDPSIVMWIGLGCALVSSLFVRHFAFKLGNAVTVLLFALWAISAGLGYPTNAPFPPHAIVYGLTADHVWAAPKDNPYPPRSYIFKAPPQWHEERDKRKGQPFEVEKVGEGEEARPGANPSDRTSEGPYVIHQHILPPKDE